MSIPNCRHQYSAGRKIKHNSSGRQGLTSQCKLCGHILTIWEDNTKKEEK